MPFFVYILYSNSTGKSYVGSSNDLDRRLWEHNHSTQKSFTSNFRPWLIIYHETFQSKIEAMKREKWFKSGIGRELKKKIIADYLN